MAEAATPPERTRETERVLRVYEKEAHKYDREMRIFERFLFAGGASGSARKHLARCSR